MFSKIKDWLFYNPYKIGRTVYWDNPVDYYFTGEYTIVSKISGTGYVDIYNKKVGKRTVPYYYLKVD